MAAVRKSVLPRDLGYRMPAEWAPHDATWLVWPHGEDWPGKLSAVQWAYCEIIRQLQEVERVQLLVQGAAAKSSAREKLREAHVPLDRVELVPIKTDRTWARDSLPLFVTSDDYPAELGAVKFGFDGWGRYENHHQDDAAGVAVAERTASRVFTPSLKLRGETRRAVLEGGSIDVDGEGTLLTTRACLLGTRFPRNPGVTRAQLEKLLEAHLGARTVIWLEDGIAGDDTSGHVDDFARFVSPGVVVCASEASSDDENHPLLRQAAKVLKSATDARGRRLTVVELPMPRAVRYQGERLPASYANFYIANEKVLVPTFNDPSDRRALAIVAELFPTRSVIGIHCLDLVVGLGTLHCSTQQQPKLGV